MPKIKQQQPKNCEIKLWRKDKNKTISSLFDAKFNFQEVCFGFITFCGFFVYDIYPWTGWFNMHKSESLDQRWIFNYNKVWLLKSSKMYAN